MAEKTISVAPDAVEFANQRIAAIRDCVKRFGNKKINLIRPDTDIREGIWCVPVTEADNRKMDDDDCSGDKFRVYLANMPLPWDGRCWGAEVIGTTRGADRPVALPEDQTPLDDDTELLRHGLMRQST